MYTADTAAMVARCLVLLLDLWTAYMRIQKIYVGPKNLKLDSQLKTLDAQLKWLDSQPTPSIKHW